MNKKKLLVLGLSSMIILGNTISYAIPQQQNNLLRSGIQNYENVIKLPDTNLTPAELVEAVKTLNLYNVNKVQLSKKDNTYYIYLTYYETKEQYNQSKSLASRIATEVEGMTDKEKVMYITQRITYLMKYNDSGNSLQFSPYSAITGEGVCQAYARFADMVFREAGLKANLVTGTLDGIAHMWNNVYINGGVYAVDITSSDLDETGKIDWSFIFMSREEINKKGYKITYTLEQLNTIQMKDKFNGIGLVSIKENRVYSNVNNGIVAVPITSTTATTETVGLGDTEDFYVVGENLLTLSDETLKVYKGKQIATNVSTEDIKSTGTGIYVNNILRFSPTVLPSERVRIVNGDYKLNFKNSGYKVIKIDGKENIFINNKFIIEIVSGGN